MICFAAHPDDETLGAGGHFSGWRGMRIIHATDGAPYNLDDARRAGFSTREQYARARRAELTEALSLAGVPADCSAQLNFVDQDCAFHLEELAQGVLSVVGELRAPWLLAPAYEGGHPDHDSLAFAVHMACRMLELRGMQSPRIVEYALYHGYPGGFHAGEFIPVQNLIVNKVVLSPSAADLKRRMISCFKTQQATLAPFPTGTETFRDAPRYDFSAPPHEGVLHYENFAWGVIGKEWRELAREAAIQLGVSQP